MGANIDAGTVVPGVPLVVLYRYFRSGVVRWAKEILADRDLDLASLVGRSS